MKQQNAILGLFSQTSIHAGTGQTTGVIDLPIQREAHNGWPCVFGSAVKGALRTKAEDSGKDAKSLTVVFGAESKSTSDHAGAIAVADARLLLFPVRSLTSQFKWVSCPAALKRYLADAKRLGLAVDMPTDFSISNNEAVVAEDHENNALFLEEYRFTTKQQDMGEVISQLAVLMGGDQAAAMLQKQLVIINDDMFSYIVQHGTAVNAHIAINSQTKIVETGALWYEETLPPETLLYVALSANKARNNESSAEMMADKILNTVTGLFSEHPWFQLGGNETVGMGWCAVTINKFEV